MDELALPDDYASVLVRLKQRVHESRHRAQRRVNVELTLLYWHIGQALAERTDDAQWGTKIIQRLSADLRAEFPESRGFSPRNLVYMRSFARAWTDVTEFAQQAVAQLPWGHITVLLDKLDDPKLRDWYAGQAAANGWTRSTLEHHLKTTAHVRFGAAPTTFDRLLDPAASDLAQQLMKDPLYLRLPAHRARSCRARARAGARRADHRNAGGAGQWVQLRWSASALRRR